MVNITFAASKLVKNGRTPKEVLMVLMEEVGELATEISINDGFKNRQASEDGIVGEAVDVILAALDIIKIHQPDITSNELNGIALNKCKKWLEVCR
jgi:NTP pyrophosphatase (non-canonical NTP hydrolase)